MPKKDNLVNKFLNYLSTEPKSTNKPSQTKNNSTQQNYQLKNRFRDGVAYHNRPSFTKISEERAMQIPAVSSSVNLISSAISKLPIYLYKTDEDGDAENVERDYRLFLLNGEPNENQTAATFKKRIIMDYLFYGGSYVYVRKKARSNEVKDLHRLPVEKVQINRYEKLGFISSYKITLDGQPENAIKTMDVACILKDTDDGYTPRGILDTGYKILSTALSEINYSGSILKNGSLPLAVLKSESQLSDEAMIRIKQDFEQLYTGGDKAGKTILLEEGLDYETVSLKPNELELTESKKSALADIARLFNIPESMINANANKYNSNEENNIHFLQYTLEPIITNIEKALNKTMLLESEKQQGYYFKFDTSVILTVTEKEKAEIAQTLNSTSAVSQNEIRKVLGLPKLEDNYMFLSQGKVFYNLETGKAFNPNMGIVFDPKNPVDTATDALKSTNDEKEEVKEKVKQELEDENDETTEDIDDKDEQLDEDLSSKNKDSNASDEELDDEDKEDESESDDVDNDKSEDKEGEDDDDEEDSKTKKRED